MKATAILGRGTGRGVALGARLAAAIVLGLVGVHMAPSTAAAQDGRLAVGVEGIIGQREVRDVLDVTDLQISDERVKATLVNNSDNRIKDIQVVVRHAFLWNDERNPGRDNPGRTEFYLVLGEIEPRGKLTFEYRPEPPLPQRDDGTFKTSIEIAGFTAVGVD